MKTKIEELLKTVTSAVETLKADAEKQDSGFTPQLGTALGGLRTAKDGLEGHLAKAKTAQPATTETAKPATP